MAHETYHRRDPSRLTLRAGQELLLLEAPLGSTFCDLTPGWRNTNGTVDGAGGVDVREGISMGEKRVTAKAFHESGGVDDWSVLAWGAHAYFKAASFSEGARFVAAVAEAAEVMGQFPDVDLRPDGVTVRTFSRGDGALSEGDVELARQVSIRAGELGLQADPSQVQVVGIAVAQDAGADVRPFWRPRSGMSTWGTRTWLIPIAETPISGSTSSTRPSPAEVGCTSMSPCLPMKRRRGSPPPSPLGAGSSTIRMRRSGGRWHHPRTTGSISPHGRIARTTSEPTRPNGSARDGVSGSGVSSGTDRIERGELT
jgi:pterin-4a-carbinolamine dehydratase